jgi:hypothetical protein
MDIKVTGEDNEHISARKLSLCVFGIEISWNDEERGGATITSNMKDAHSLNSDLFNVAVDGIESIILAHFCAGVDVDHSSYIEGIVSSHQAVCNNMDETDPIDTLPSVDGEYFQWLLPTDTDDGPRYLGIEGDEINLSDLLFSSPEEAIDAIKDNIWGWCQDDAKDFILAKVNKTFSHNPFATGSISVREAGNP